MSKKIDHLVYCTQNIQEAIIDLESRLGTKVTIGGKHLNQGTQNALINLGGQCYLEILAVDHHNNIKGPKWMGLDVLQSDKLTRWAIKSEDIIQDSNILEAYNSEMGIVEIGTRKMIDGKILSWQMAMPLPYPEIDIVPFITDWSKSEIHPTDTLHQSCEMIELNLNHPKPTTIQYLLTDLDVDIKIKQADRVFIEAIIQTPKGIVIL